MFYEPRKKNHGLPHDPYTAIVGPRPIGWISSISLKGEINLAPYSFFNSVSSDPPMVMFASDGRKQTSPVTRVHRAEQRVWDSLRSVTTAGARGPLLSQSQKSVLFARGTSASLL